MSGRHNPPYSQYYQQHMNNFTIPETLSETMPATPNTENLEPPESETARVLGYFVHMTKSQLDLLASPPYAYVCTRFLEQLSRGDITLNQVFNLLSLHDAERSPDVEWLRWGNVADGSNESMHSSHATSSQSSVSVAYQGWQAPVPFHNPRNNPPHDILGSAFHQPTSSFHSKNGPLSTSTVECNTPSTQSAPSNDNDNHSNALSFNDPLCVPDGISQPYGTPRSIVCHTPRPPSGQEITSDFLSSPQARRRPSACSSQLSDTPSPYYKTYNKWINNDAARMNTNKKSKRAPKTPCPRCPDKAFENRAEFVKHVIAVHEQPVEYQCNHYLPGKQGEKYFCSESKWHFSSWAKHHTQQHSGICGQKQSQQNPSPSCRKEIVNDRPVQQRGCWLCNHLSFSAEHWVDHHLGRHRGSPRRAMSQTWAMKSLLSNPDITVYWQVQIKTLEMTTGHFWDLKWANDSEDATTLELVKSLETGFFNGKNFHEDLQARAQLAKAVMDATINHRDRLSAISPYRMRGIETDFHNFRRYLAATARSAANLADETKRLKRAASSSPLSGYGRAEQVGPWLQTQHNISNAPFLPLELSLGHISPSLLDADV